MTKTLTEKQQLFLQVLFEEANGDAGKAKQLAGYSKGTAINDIVTSLKDEIMDATQTYMARNAPKAAVALAGGLYDPTELGIRDKMAAAKELLDRTGLIDRLVSGRDSARRTRATILPLLPWRPRRRRTL